MRKVCPDDHSRIKHINDAMVDRTVSVFAKNRTLPRTCAFIKSTCVAQRMCVNFSLVMKKLLIS